MRDIDKYQSDYLENPFEKELLSFRHDKACESLLKYKAKYVLEVGCGMKPLFDYFSNFDYLSIVEPSQIFYSNAHTSKPDKVEVFKAFFNNEFIINLDRKYDFVVISSLLHELENPKEILLAAKKILTEGGTIHINVPNAKSIHRILAQRMGLIQDLYEKSERQVQYQQASTYDMDSLRRLVMDCGLKEKDSGTLFIKPFTHRQMQKMLDEKIIDQAVLDGLDKLVFDLPGKGAEIYMNVGL